MKKRNKRIVMMASIIIVFAMAVSSTIAWLFTSTNEVVNTFTPTEVPNKVVETFDGTTKTYVTIKNEGNIPAYVRAKIVVNWAEVKADGTPTKNVFSVKPVEGRDFKYEGLSGTGWVKYGDYYYYTSPVAANTVVPSYLFTECVQLTNENVPTSSTDGCKYVLSVEIMGQTIQADGVNSTTNKTPVQEAWGVTISGGTVTPKS